MKFAVLHPIHINNILSYVLFFNIIKKICPPTISHSQVHVLARAAMDDWKIAQHSNDFFPPANETRNFSGWSKPAAGFLKCNCDPAFFSLENRTGYGFCMRNHDGAFMLAKTEWSSPNSYATGGQR